ncbi:MAG TPA: 6-carboxytetrahydropterin synthase [Tepidisphaeraceae bacterium]|nr:6-carboxytetrahydropterin synthase [Tepidisphaeraceae bacterium]
MLLQREIRVVVDAQGRLVDTSNRWSGGAVLQIGQTPLVCSAVVSSPLDSDGMSVEVKDIDQLMRVSLADVLQSGSTTLIDMTSGLFRQLSKRLSLPIELKEISLASNPQNKITMQQASTNSALVTQQFEFSAAHQLVGCSEDGSARDFGKCARVHGHNYVFDVTVRVGLDRAAVEDVTTRLQRIVNSAVVAKLDHRNLNDEVAEFSKINPTVEQITVVIWNLLAPQLGNELVSVRLYETPKTWAEYCGPDA